jgi:hypothetical protein
MGVRIEAGVYVEEIIERGLKVRRNESTELIEGDSLVIATGMEPLRGLYEKLKGKVTALYLAGDCLEPQHIGEALWRAFDIAMRI